MWHFVRVCDLKTRQLMWQDTQTHSLFTTVEVAQHGRVCQ